MKKVKIVCTIGPACEDFQTLRAMVRAGMDVARFNFSHGTREEHRRRIRAVKQAANEEGKFVALLADTRGPEIRIGRLPGGRITLGAGDWVTLGPEEEAGVIPVNCSHLAELVRPGQTVLLDDGRIALTVLLVTPEGRVRCRVENDGELKSGKGLVLPGVDLPGPAITEPDREDLRLVAEEDMDYVAVSFVRGAADVEAARQVLREYGADVPVIAKIETRSAVQNLGEILAAADGVMVARGDLGLEMPTEEVPVLQKRIIRQANQAGKPVITATQMLESMLDHPRPTRAEASDVANAVLDGSDAVMLSGETAVGAYPVEAVRIMANIISRAEEILPYEDLLLKSVRERPREVTQAIGQATCTIALSLGASAVITPTVSGFTARTVAGFRPSAPIIAASPSERVLRSLCLVWGVTPVLVKPFSSTDEMIRDSVKAALNHGLIKPGNLVVITAGVPAGVPGSTNLLKVERVEPAAS